MKAAIIVIGNELLCGRVADTNSGWIAARLDRAGIETAAVLTVGDTGEEISYAVGQALSLAGIVILTGGLGPTKDDVTKHTLASLLGNGKMHHDEEAYRNALCAMARRGRPMNALTATQAMVPDGCTPLPNPVGTAPGMLFTTAEGALVFSLPGVPFEMKRMMEEQVMPRLPQSQGWHHAFFNVHGISESALAERLAGFEDSLSRSPSRLAYLPRSGGYITLRLDSRDPSLLPALSREIESICGNLIFSTGDETPAETLLGLMRRKGLRLATAESCTGGNIAHSVTLIPGASDVMTGGVVSYSNEAKSHVLGVDAALIERHGAVSEPVAMAMARGACRALEADLAVATSGIAGPGGGTAEKPVGTVCFGLCCRGEVRGWTEYLPGSRERVIERATSEALIAAIRAVGG